MAKSKKTAMYVGGGALALLAIAALAGAKKGDGGSSLPGPGAMGDTKQHMGVSYRVQGVSGGYIFYIETSENGWEWVDDGPFETVEDAELAARQYIEELINPLPGVDSEPGGTLSNTRAS